MWLPLYFLARSIASFSFSCLRRGPISMANFTDCFFAALKAHQRSRETPSE